MTWNGDIFRNPTGSVSAWCFECFENDKRSTSLGMTCRKRGSTCCKCWKQHETATWKCKNFAPCSSMFDIPTQLVNFSQVLCFYSKAMSSLVVSAPMAAVLRQVLGQKDGRTWAKSLPWALWGCSLGLKRWSLCQAPGLPADFVIFLMGVIFRFRRPKKRRRVFFWMIEHDI